MQAEKLTVLNLTVTNENLNFDSCTEEGREEQGSSNSAPSSQEQLKFIFPLCQHKKFNTHEKTTVSLARDLWCQGRKLEKITHLPALWGYF